MSGRIPQYFIDELVARADIVELIGSRVPLKKYGKEFKACCPFHNEKTPSFTVIPDKQFYYCFGCQARGTALGFLMDHDHMSFVEAVEELAAKVGLEVPREGGHTARPAAPADDLFSMLEKAAELYRQELKRSDRGKDYFTRRGLTGETAAKFGLGYAPDAWDFSIRHLGTAGVDRMRLQQVGLIIERERRPDMNGDPGHYDRFRDRVMFPIRDARGRTIGFGGRVLDQGEPKYLNSPETELFHKGRELYGLYEVRQASRTLPRLLIVEGYMDVVRLHQAGVTYAVATLGTATTPEHLSRVFRLCQELVFCFDGDRAGRAAAWKALENSLSHIREGRQIKFLFLPDGHDPDSLVGEEGQEAFEVRVAGAIPLSEYFLSHLREQVDMTVRDGRARFKELALPLLERIPEGAFRDALLVTINRLAQIDTGLVAAHGSGLSARESGSRHGASFSDRHFSQAAGRGSVVRQAIRLLVQFPACAAGAPGPEGLEGIERPGIPLLIELLNDLRENPCANTAALLERWRGRPDYEHLFKLASSEVGVGAEGAAQELAGALQQIFPERADQRRDELLRKNTREGLTEAERAELQRFLTRSQHQADAAGHRT